MVKLFQETVRRVCSKDYTSVQLEAWVGKVDLARWEKTLAEHTTLLAFDGEALAGFGDSAGRVRRYPSGRVSRPVVCPVGFAGAGGWDRPLRPAGSGREFFAGLHRGVCYRPAVFRPSRVSGDPGPAGRPAWDCPAKLCDGKKYQSFFGKGLTKGGFCDNIIKSAAAG